MSRPLRIQFNGAWYHVMNRGAGRRSIFTTDTHRKQFLKLLDEITQIYGIEVHLYCLMGNHYHLVIHTPRGNLSEAMRQLNSRYTQIFNRMTKRDGPLFRGRYKAILISAEQYLLHLSRYIHRNPLDAKMVKDLEHYRWSSFPSYLGEPQDLENLKIDEVLKRFKQRKFKGSYKKFVYSSKDDELEQFYSSKRVKPVLGDDDYCEAVYKQLRRESLSTEIVGADRIIAPPDFETIIETVSAYYGVHSESILKCEKRVKHRARRIVMILTREIGGLPLQEIAVRMNNVTYSTVSNTISRGKSDITLQKDLNLLKTRIIKSAKKLSEVG